MKLFLKYEAEGLTSPFLMNQAFEAIEILDVPGDCEEFHDGLLDQFE
jgi:hypothetical protein